MNWETANKLDAEARHHQERAAEFTRQAAKIRKEAAIDQYHAAEELNAHGWAGNVMSANQCTPVGCSTELDLDHIFSYHSARIDQQKSYETIRAHAKLLAQTILDYVPDCPDRSVAIRKLREVVMIANAAVALDGRLTK